MSGRRIGCGNICGSDIGIDSGDSGFRPAHGLLERLRGLPNLELRGIDSPRTTRSCSREMHSKAPHTAFSLAAGNPMETKCPPPSVFKAFFVVLKALTCEHTANAERS